MPNLNADRFMGPPGVVNMNQVPPGPAASASAVPTGPPPGQGPVPPTQGPIAGPVPGPPGPVQVPAPNSQGSLTPEQVQIVGAVISDPIMLETVINLAAQQMQAQTQGIPAGPPASADAALFGGI